MEIKPQDVAKDKNANILTASDDEDASFDYPKYSDEGWLLVEVVSTGQTGPHEYKWSIEESAYDGCVFWIQEGIGFDYFINDVIDNSEITHDGFWIIENIIGYFKRGDGYSTDDDEEWNIGKIRPATDEEIAAQKPLS